MGLRTYNQKRNFRRTPEPSGKRADTGKSIFVIQKHDASHLHYDLRLELDGSLKSWAVPKGPSLDPHQRRLAMQVEDHPIEYAKFEGTIPKGEYGGGEVIVWDYGTWKSDGDPKTAYRKGRLEFELHGKKLRGKWILVRTRTEGDRAQWLLIKRADEAAQGKDDEPITESDPQSARSGKLLTRDQLARGARAAASIANRARVQGKAPALKSRKKFASNPKIDPQLATLVDSPPLGDRWIHEIKFDGYRTICQLRNGMKTEARFFTRSGLDWSTKYSVLGEEVSRLPAKSLCMDGEIVVLDRDGRSDFSLLQAVLKGKASAAGLIYYVFDLLELDGRDLRAFPLIERKMILKNLLRRKKLHHVRYSDHWDGTGGPLLKRGCELGLEGIISKDKLAPYSPGRSALWLKSKCIQGQEVIIAGYTEPEGTRTGFGSLVLAANSTAGELLYLGRVGTGFDRRKIRELLAKMRPLEIDRSPFSERVPIQDRIHWVKPKLVAEIYFHGWTADRHVRQAVFRDLRSDKPASQVTVDFSLPPERQSRADASRRARTKKMPRRSRKVAPSIRTEIPLTHPEKILIPGGNVTKARIRDYLVAVSPWMLPHIADRPLALVRCPDNVEHECFFQKNLTHKGNGELKSASTTDPKGKKGSLIYIDSVKGLETLAQMGTIETHCWGTHRDHPRKPDLLVFDLDPDPEVSWVKVAGAATRLRDILEELGLRSFLKVSGNKGLHLHIPIEPTVDWETAKTFAHAVSLVLVEENPRLYLATMSKAKRKGKIFIDFFRNGYGATSIAPYSIRTKNHGAVALPIAWSEVGKVDPAGFSMNQTLAKLKRRQPGGAGDPWKDYFKVRQRLPNFHRREVSGHQEVAQGN